MNYNEIYKNCKNPAKLREELVEDALNLGVKRAARKWGTTPKTVRKWRDRRAAEGDAGLRDRPRRPKSSPRRMPLQFQFKIRDATEKAIRDNKRTNAAQVREENAIPFSQRTVRKEMKKCGYSTRWRRKSQRKKDLHDVKSKMRVFEKIQIDIKYLDDISEFHKDWRRFALPRYQITARDVKTGTLFFAFAREKSSTNTTIFLLLLGRHLAKCGVDLRTVTVQTDNGSEFATPRNSEKDSAFTKVVKKIWQSEHKRIPPKACTWNSDVETSHNLIENEFYAHKYFHSREDFFKKAADWQCYFNTERVNKCKKGSPAQLMAGAYPDEVLKFEPVVVDNFWDSCKDDFVAISSA